MFLAVMNTVWQLMLSRIATVILSTGYHLSLSYFHKQNLQLSELFCELKLTSNLEAFSAHEGGICFHKVFPSRQ